jgi:hypothetical protein
VHLLHTVIGDRLAGPLLLEDQAFGIRTNHAVAPNDSGVSLGPQTARHRLWCTGNCGTLTHESRSEFTVTSSVMSSAAQFRIARQNW